MIYIILGDDIIGSRERFLQLKEKYKIKGFEIAKLDHLNIFELDKWLYQSTGLFADKKVFFGENLLSKKEHRETLKKYDTENQSINIVIWEEKLEERAVRFIFKNSKLHTAKLPHNIFKFLDAIYPVNLNAVMSFFQPLSLTLNEHLILVMLQKRLRELILIKGGQTPEKKLASWQIARLKIQAAKWDEQRLIPFYDALYRIELFAKTNGHYYSVKKALDILFCYYL